MSGVAGAALIGGGVAAAGAIGSGLIAKGGAQDAAAAQAAANAQGIAAQERMSNASISAQREFSNQAAQVLRDQYGQARTDLEPFRQAQLSALNQAQGLTDPNSEIYQNERRLATEAIQKQLAAQGMLRSKNQVDLLSNLEVGLAGERFNRVNALAGIGAVQQGAQMATGLGQGLSSIYGNLGQGLSSTFQNTGNTLSGLYQGLGNINAQGALGSAQANAGIFSGLVNLVQGSLANYNSQDFLNNLLNNRGLGSGSVRINVPQVPQLQNPQFGGGLSKQYSLG